MVMLHRCAGCGYDRRGIGPDVVCPECGRDPWERSVRFDGNRDLWGLLGWLGVHFGLVVSLPLAVVGLLMSGVVGLTHLGPWIWWSIVVQVAAVWHFNRRSMARAGRADEGSRQCGPQRVMVMKMWAEIASAVLVLVFLGMLMVFGLVA